MVDELGKATGPQRRPRKPKVTPPAASEVMEKPQPAEPRNGSDRMSDMYNAVTTRIEEQVELMHERLQNMPLGGDVEFLEEGLIHRLNDLEARITSTRVELDQLGCSL